MIGLIIGKIGGNFGNGKHPSPSVEIRFGGLLGYIRGKIGNRAAAAKIANNSFKIQAVSYESQSIS
ncbi:MAG: hypothetical protein H0X30_30135 [Anaerolineae bacterium]|nr:hypothetical protein [Anaerolineae bacterium]